jgi:hypothetical protein
VGKLAARTRSPVNRRVSGWLAMAGGAMASILLAAGCCLSNELLLRASRLPVCEACLASFARITRGDGPARRLVCGPPGGGGARRFARVASRRGCPGAAAQGPSPRTWLQPGGAALETPGQAAGLPHQGVLLARKRPRPDKHLLTSHERWEAVRGAFATRPGSQVDNRRVLLVDDVMTTGATLDACAKALREAGASAVLGLTVARAILSPRKVSR